MAKRLTVRFGAFAIYIKVANPLNIPKLFIKLSKFCQDNKIIMATQFGDRVRELRTKQKLLLRQVASRLDVDTSIISKIERGDRPIKKEQIGILAEILKANKEELLTLWLADQIYNVIKDEQLAAKAIDVAQEGLKIKSKQVKKK